MPLPDTRPGHGELFALILIHIRFIGSRLPG
jgi:hypothetical protein